MDYTALVGELSDLSSARRWLVGLSGGIDSSVLLDLLVAWRRERPGLPSLGAIHVNHGLQAGADDWQAHCQAFCDERDVPLLTRAVDVSEFGTGEAAARAARYSVFEEEIGEGDVLLLAHHLDDQVETFFLRLMRGAGVEGLAAMPARRALGNGRLVRPLLATSRSELQAYAAEQELGFVDDPSNDDPAMDRNFLRGQVLPLLEQRWPAYRATVSRATAHMASAAALLAEHVAVPETEYTAMGDPGIGVPALMLDGEEAACARLRSWLRTLGIAAPDRAVLVEFLRQLRQGAPSAAPQLMADGRQLRRYRDALYLLPVLDEAALAQTQPLPPGQSLQLPGVGRLALEPVLEDGLEGGLALGPGEVPSIAWRDSASRCRLLGKEHSSSIKQLLQENGVPPWWRDHVPLLWVGEELLCVGDLARCASPRWRDKTHPGQALWRFVWQRPQEPVDK